MASQPDKPKSVSFECKADVNSVQVAHMDEVIEIAAGEVYKTADAAVISILDDHPSLKRASAADSKSEGKS